LNQQTDFAPPRTRESIESKAKTLAENILKLASEGRLNGPSLEEALKVTMLSVCAEAVAGIAHPYGNEAHSRCMNARRGR
jgi:hypothetical protein